MDEIRIGISSCLLGEEVRYDGGHKRHRYLTDTVGEHVVWVPLCPEVEIGLGTPRETIRLARRGTDGAIRLVAPASGADHTETMSAFAEETAVQIPDWGLSGYILKKDSPSCGMERVKVYDGEKPPERTGTGIFAKVLLERHPHLPVEEEGRLNDPRLRENFFERVFAWRRLRDFLDTSWDTGGLVAFHTREKFLLLAHDPESYQALGRLVARAAERDRDQVAADYEEGFMSAMEVPATRGRHRNVLEHMAGFFKEGLSGQDKAELGEVFEAYADGLVPLVVPITLVRHHVRVLGVDYLVGQTYLEPHPRELMLRNHV